MKKLILILVVAVTALAGFNACNQCKQTNSDCNTTAPPDKRYVQYFIAMVDTLQNSPFTYYAKFNNNTNKFPVTPNSVFTFSFPNNSNPDSVEVKVFAEKSGTHGNINVIWFKEGVNFDMAHCPNDTLFKTCIINGPRREEVPAITGPGNTIPVPIGVVQPVNNNNP